MYATSTRNQPKLFCYNVGTTQHENDNDVGELFTKAAKDRQSRLVVFGGLHGYQHTGEPTGQSNAEKGVCSFFVGRSDV